MTTEQKQLDLVPSHASAIDIQALRSVSHQLRSRRVNNGTEPSPTLVAWADQIDAAIAGFDRPNAPARTPDVPSALLSIADRFRGRELALYRADPDYLDLAGNDVPLETRNFPVRDFWKIQFLVDAANWLIKASSERQAGLDAEAPKADPDGAR